MEIYEQRDSYIYAAILDPRFKFDWSTGSELLRIEARFRDFLSSVIILNSKPKEEQTLSFMSSSNLMTANTLGKKEN